MEDIKEKADYCLSCRTKPCKKGCPLDNDITEFIKQVKENNYEEAYKIATQTSVLQSICGRVCPHMSQCEGNCVRGFKGAPVCIGDIEAFIGDKAIEQNYTMSDLPKVSKNLRVAIIGSGPAGLTCAAFLARNGVQCTIYEKYDCLGGLLLHGIPEFRLSRETIKKSIENSIVFGAYENDRFVGMARVITDFATTFYIADVIVDEKYRGKGIGKKLVSTIISDNRFSTLLGILVTRDAHGLYEHFGFVKDSERAMTRRV